MTKEELRRKIKNLVALELGATDYGSHILSTSYQDETAETIADKILKFILESDYKELK